MSENYSPDPDAEPQSPYDVAFLSQRDVSLKVPINYVSASGVSFTAACLPFGRYESDNSADCLSNLLAVGFRRYELDLYWDQGRSLWSFCPVAIPASISSASTSSDPILSLTPSALSALTSDAAPTGTSTFSLTEGSSFGARQQPTGTFSSSPATAAPTVSTTSSGSLSVTATSLGDTNPTIAILPNDPNEPLISIGPYLCTTTINLSTFTSQFLDYIQKTENTLSAHLLYVILNIHAAVSNADPIAPAPAPTNLPGASDALGGLFSVNLSAYIYTPSNLRSDRANLNASWYNVVERYQPAGDYYNITFDSNGIASTDDGWPSESYIEFSKSKRLLLGWGNFDPQMAGYNFSMDVSTIFPSGYIQDVQTDISVTGSGRLTSGCFLSDTTQLLSEINSSWAMETNLPGFDYPTSATSDIFPLLNLTANTTNCGISPILNVTLLNSTAHTNFQPYQNVSYTGGIWSWAHSEPKTYNSSTSSGIYRCAIANPDHFNRWVVADCSQRYYAACRAPSSPYNWTITTYPISYSYASQACPSGWDFAAPRTALENSYLGRAVRDDRRDYDGHGLWIDFNSLDVAGCWTTGGPNATCPYTDTVQQENDLKRRIILVPTVAAILVLVVTAMTIFVKCAGNRKVRKRVRKRADNGFVYEGVPS